MNTENKWKAEEIKGAHKWEVTAQTSDTTWEVIALVYSCIADDGDETGVGRRAKFICKAVNSHDQLVESLEKLLRLTSTIECLGEWEALDINTGLRKTNRAKVDEAINAACAILKKAKGEA